MPPRAGKEAGRWMRGPQEGPAAPVQPLILLVKKVTAVQRRPEEMELFA